MNNHSIRPYRQHKRAQEREDVETGGGSHGAVTACGVDLSKPLSDADLADVLRGIGTHGVVCFPDQ